MKSFKQFRESIVQRYATPHKSVEGATNARADELTDQGHTINSIGKDTIEHEKGGQKYRTTSFVHHTGDVWNKTERI